MWREITEVVETRVRLNLGSLAALLALYIALVVAGVFVFAGFFIWLAETRSLVAACAIFAVAFLAMAAVAGIMRAIYARRVRIARASTNITRTIVENPAAMLLGWRVLRLMRRAPFLSVGTALAAGIAWSMLGARRHQS